MWSTPLTTAPTTTAPRTSGLDGLNSEAEQTFFATWLNGLSTELEPDAFAQYQNDPSADDFRYFRDPVAQANDEDILERYQFFSRYEGSNTQQLNGYPITSTTIPNTEDINEDLTLGTIESYYQYEIPMTRADLSPDNIGKGYSSRTFWKRCPKPTARGNSVPSSGTSSKSRCANTSARTMASAISVPSAS